MPSMPAPFVEFPPGPAAGLAIPEPMKPICVGSLGR